MFKKTFILIFVIASTCFYCNQPAGTSRDTSSDEKDLIEIYGSTMGTTYSVKIVNPASKNGESNQILSKRISTDIDDLLRTVNRQMSTWLKDSEISCFNRYTGSDWFTVSEDTAFVVKEARRVSELCGGAFDITVGPLVNLWGFGPPETNRTIPNDQAIKETMNKIGYAKLSVQMNPPSIKKDIPGLYCDLSAIAKGFGVDKAAEYLESKNYKNYIVEIGGEVRTGGMKHNRFWRVGIASPNGGSSIEKVIELKDASMATSGDYHNYFEKNGIRYSHTIDPAAGRPITHKLASVSVLHKFCCTADAYATAINVMGPEKGYEWAVKENLPVLLIIHDRGNRFVEKMTPQFKKYIPTR